jgi:hypothetical protein
VLHCLDCVVGSVREGADRPPCTGYQEPVYSRGRCC